jgi:hypothetical protein
MKQFPRSPNWLITGNLVACVLFGCGQKVSPPPQITPEIQVQIDQEAKAVEDAEKEQQRLANEGRSK